MLTKGGAREEDFDSQVKILPKCRYGKDLAITARGYFYPCTSCESSDTTSWFYRNREHFDLRVHPMEQILRSPKWRELESLWERSSGAPQSCLNYCGVHQDYVAHYSEGSRRDRPNKPPDIVEVQLT